MSLARIQQEFLDVVLGEGPLVDPGMALYRDNALAARRDALAAAYPVVRRLVGEAFFAEAAERFARAHPSTSGDLHAYGRALADFLAGYGPAESLAYLPDVARLEWAVHECEVAADGAPLDHGALATLPGSDLPGLTLTLHPAVRLVESEHPVLAIWEANQAGRDGTPDREAGPDRVVVRREGLAVVPVLADAHAWALMTAFARGLPLGEACASLERPDRDFAPALARIAGWGALGPHDPGGRP